VLLVVAALLALIGGVIAVASGLWLSVMAYKRARTASKSVAS